MKILYQKTKQGLFFEVDAKAATLAILANAVVWVVGKHMGWL